MSINISIYTIKGDSLSGPVVNLKHSINEAGWWTGWVQGSVLHCGGHSVRLRPLHTPPLGVDLGGGGPDSNPPTPNFVAQIFLANVALLRNVAKISLGPSF